MSLIYTVNLLFIIFSKAIVLLRTVAFIMGSTGVALFTVYPPVIMGNVRNHD